jgi:uncharacterized membrane protein
MIKHFSKTFVTGLLTLLPLIITLWVVGVIANYLRSKFGTGSLYHSLILKLFPGEGFGLPMWLGYIICLILTILIIWLIGNYARHFLWQQIRKWIEDIISRIPLINTVYSSIDQVSAMLIRKDSDKTASMEIAVLIKLANTCLLGMLTSRNAINIIGKPHYLVYIPSSPFPTTGFNYLVPCEDVIEINLTIEEITRITISLGTMGASIMNSKQSLFVSNSGPS